MAAFHLDVAAPPFDLEQLVQEACGKRGVGVEPGDLVVADVDGIVVIPAALAEQVADAVAAKSALEESARKDLLSGKSVREVWDAYGVF